MPTIEDLERELGILRDALQGLKERDRGQIILCATDAPPEGCLPCNGQVYDLREEASKHLRPLFEVIGNRYGGDGMNTFAVPELRGEFIRVFDAGRGVDIGRVLGRPQLQSTAPPQQAFKIEIAGEHDHTLDQAGSHSHCLNLETTASRDPDGDQCNTAAAWHIISDRRTLDAGQHGHTLHKAGGHNHTISGGDTETRPRNVALAAFIRF